MLYISQNLKYRNSSKTKTYKTWSLIKLMMSGFRIADTTDND